MAHSRLIDGKFNKQGDLLMKLILGGHKMSRSPHPLARILNIYIEALTGFSLIYSPDGLNTLLSQGHVLGTALSMGMVSRVHSKDRGGCEKPSVA